MKCKECGYTKEIRKEICEDPEETITYYRCKDCGYQWEGKKMKKKDKKMVDKWTNADPI